MEFENGTKKEVIPIKTHLKLIFLSLALLFFLSFSVNITEAADVDWKETTYYVNYYNEYKQTFWLSAGTKPWIDDSIDSNIYTPVYVVDGFFGWFEFLDLSSGRFPENITLQILAKSEISGYNITCFYRMDKSNDTSTANSVKFQLTASYIWYNLTLPNLNSVDDFNNFRIGFMKSEDTSAKYVYVLKACVTVWHSIKTYYTFHGLLNENTGQYEGSVYVTAFVQGCAPEIFLVDGIITRGFIDRPDYFLFQLGDVNREFHPHTDGRDDYADLYIFNGSNLFYYDITYYDVADVLSEYPYAIVERKINGTWMTVEQHKLDYTRVTRFALDYGSYYRFSVRDHDIYVIGDIQAKTNPTIEITINPVQFTVAEYDKYIFVYNHVICIATRSNDGTSILIRYADSLAQTSSVTIYIRYMNGTVVSGFPEVLNEQAFSYTWSNADNETNYLVDAVVDHGKFGVFTYDYALDCVYTGAVFDLSFFGTPAGLDMTLLAPVFLLICVGGSFSSLNAHVGMVATCLVFVLFCAVGWLNFGAYTPSIIAVALTLAVISGVSHAKRVGVIRT